MSGVKGMGTPRQDLSPIPNASASQAASTQELGKGPSEEDLAGLGAVTAQDMNAQAQAPEIQGAPSPSPQAQPSLDDIFSTPQQAQSAPSLDDIFSNNVASRSGGPMPVPEGSDSPPPQDLAARAKASFAMTPKEKASSLMQSFGANNVRQEGKDFFIKDSSGKEHKFAGDSSILGFLADHARTALEGGVMGAATAATDGAGALVGAGMLGHAAGDAVQGVLGIPRDPDRSQAAEYATAGATNLLAGGLLNKFAGAGANGLANEAAKAGEAMAAPAATQAVAKAVAAPADEQLVNEAKETLASVDRLRLEHGIDMPVSQGQVFTNDNQTKSELSGIAGTKTYQQGLRAIGARLQTGWDKLISLVGDVGDSTGVGNKTLDTANSLDKVYGQVIGTYRASANDAAGEGLLPTPKFVEALRKAGEDLGATLSEDGGGVNQVDPSMLMNRFGMGRREASLLANKVNNYMEDSFNGDGRMKFEDLAKTYTDLTKLISNNVSKPDVSRQFKGTLIDIKNAIRDDMTNTIGTVLDPEAKASYQQSMNRYFNIHQAYDTLGGMLDKDSVSTGALADQLFAKNNLDKLQAMRSLVENENPDQWRKLVGSYFDNVRATNTDPATNITNWGGVRKKLMGLGSDVQTEIWGEQGPQLIDDFTSAAAKLSNERAENMNAPAMQGAVKKLMMASLKLWHGDAVAAGKAIASIGPGESSVAQYFSRTSINARLAGLSPAMKPTYQQMINAAVDSIKSAPAQAAKGASQMAPGVMAGIGAQQANQQ